MIFMIIYIYSYVYLCIYTPSYQHFKAFAVSKFDSESTFLYQLFNKNLKFTVYKPFNMFLQVYMYVYIYIYTISNQHFKAFTVSTVTTSTGLCATCTRQETRMSFCVLTCTRASFLEGGGVPTTILSPCMECLNVSNTETKYTHAYLLDLLCIPSTE